MAETNLPPPAYLHDPFVMGLLNTLLTNLEKGRVRPLQVNSKTLPALFDYRTENSQYLWSLVVSLADEYAVFSIKTLRQKPGVEVYEKARLTLEPDAEALLRYWLQRPSKEPYGLSWKNAVLSHAHYFVEGGEALLAKPIRREGTTAAELVAGFARAAGFLHKPITLRALSAQCFWADSKFLDTREELLLRLLPSAKTFLLPRPLLIHVALAKKTKEVLFVENQDTFLQLVAAQGRYSILDNMSLVNSAGFRAAASRIRQRGAIQFSHVHVDDKSDFLGFDRWWFAEGSAGIKCYFWGDLDYSGMAILAALGQSFSGIEAWQPAYQAMLHYHQRGVSHSGEAAGKERQQDPGASHCVYTQKKLLPLLRATQRFVDQEVVTMADLQADEYLAIDKPD